MLKQEIILIGGGGHCKSCIDVIEQTGQYSIRGVLDRADLAGTNVLGYEIIGTDEDILKFKEEGCVFLITIGQIKSAAVRKSISKLLEDCGAVCATVISPLANVSRHAQIGKGTIVMHGVKVNAAAKIGDNCILNTNCLIEHDTVIGDHTHVSTSAVINGNCVIGDEVFIGSNATIAGQVSLGSSIVIGAGSVVIKSVDEAGIYAGNPVNKINK